MLCDLCGKNEAVLFIEQANENNKRKLSICFECAKAHGISPDSVSIGKSLSNLFDTILGAIAPSQNPDKTKLCPVCGISLLEIKNTKKVGCPECYSIFKDDISTLFKNIGVTSAYTGTMPKRLKNFHSVLNDRIVLQSKLEESIKNEDYEKAAIYRDYIRALEKTPVSGGEDD